MGEDQIGHLMEEYFFQIQDNYSNPNTGTRRLIPDYLKTESGSYFTTSLVPSNNFSVAFWISFWASK